MGQQVGCNMNNRELLIYAARAGDIDGKYYIAYGEREVNEGIDIGGGHLWNPILSNADAFSLMVNMYMDVKVSDKLITANNPDTGVSFGQPVNHDGDLNHATRLAITNCAAIVGSNL